MKHLSEDERGQLGHAIGFIGFNYVQPIWWGQLNEPQGEVLANGTAFVIETPDKVFAVTAGHVLQGCIDDLEADSHLMAKFGDLAFRPQKHLIDLCSSPDLATFEIPRDLPRRIGVTPVALSPASWPTAVPAKNEVVFLSGFPGQERQPEASDREAFGSYSAILTVTSSSHQSISLQIDHSRIEDYLGLGLPEPGYDMGGVSGAPLFHLFSRRGVWSWYLVGVVFQASASLDLVKAAPAIYLDSNGRIERM